MLAVSLCGCAPEVVPSSGPRPPTRLEEVKVYQKPPKKYEDLGVIEVRSTPEMSLNAQGHSPATFAVLKGAAAAKGANGLLLGDKQLDREFTALVGDGTADYHVAMRHDPPTVLGRAIYVIKE
jgi:hypothetical protein